LKCQEKTSSGDIGDINTVYCGIWTAHTVLYYTASLYCIPNIPTDCTVCEKSVHPPVKKILTYEGN
jgi:hypothetical protein